MSVRLRFRRLYKRLPGWLSDDSRSDGAPLLYSTGLIIDAFLERARQSIEARFPLRALTNEALEYLGRDRGILRGRAESDESYAQRLIEWRYPFGHRVRGNAWGMLAQIRFYFLSTTKQFAITRRGSWFQLDADATETYALDTGLFAGGDDLPVSPNWARFWLGINAPVGWSLPVLTIGDPNLWGGVISDDSEYVIGLDGATQSDIQAFRIIAEDWKMSGSKAEYLFVVLDSAFTDDMNSYVQKPSTSWFTFGGDQVALGNAQTVPIPL